MQHYLPLYNEQGFIGHRFEDNMHLGLEAEVPDQLLNLSMGSSEEVAAALATPSCRKGSYHHSKPMKLQDKLGSRIERC